MNIKLISAFGAALLLAACSGGDHKGATTGNGGGTQAPTVSGPVPGSQADLVANVGDRVFFEFNSNKLTDDARATLNRQADWLKKYPNVQVMIAGNCDDRGTEEYNIALGSRRANAARDYLVSLGVASDRMTTISYGKDKPIAEGDNEEAWSQNRNATTSVR
ncbi:MULTISPECIES: peptidoglycan-associated lipoprotein Pal [Commensalibacter]|uniref:Peptidoglycan-associated lipoprotein n=1 Tax=Commensalibacter melissae TaxID=2070537 RepID=A0A318MWN7_9PROT|nr:MULTISPECIES: peptidoglycan-associated lipoprotein Pal [Commensalibacter]MCT6852895.1 peptidoglycan-associated lipoprotein Pal [Commensalibacter sp.]AYN86599.1 peptidoglycan-associated lipoprotein Pal [Commensalibacter melissae]MBH9969875.1 peptidoglycan-associated lipoprotein Pal [Commensalibacter sp. M0265]MBH9972547.1 peptidoglycan-associated lipoprotein Pal [Commensalibacter melissae]MBH9977229.1 peptidoglycan-associated lipoprotein Pal [Commensalibacter sp. M0266]